MKENVVRVFQGDYLLLLIDIFGDGGELEEMYISNIWTIGPHLPFHHGFLQQSPLIIAS